MSASVIQARGVFCVHRTPEGDVAALQGATLDVGPGRLVCVLGPSGAGKSTLLRVIAGLQIPAAGTVMLAGRDIGRLGERDRAALRRRQIGLVTQSADAVLAPELTATEIVTLPLALRGSDRARTAEISIKAGLVVEHSDLYDIVGDLRVAARHPQQKSRDSQNRHRP